MCIHLGIATAGMSVVFVHLWMLGSPGLSIHVGVAMGRWVAFRSWGWSGGRIGLTPKVVPAFCGPSFLLVHSTGWRCVQETALVGRLAVAVVTGRLGIPVSVVRISVVSGVWIFPAVPCSLPVACVV